MSTNYQTLQYNLVERVSELTFQANARLADPFDLTPQEHAANVYADLWCDLFDTLLTHFDGNPSELASILRGIAYDHGIDLTTDDCYRRVGLTAAPPPLPPVRVPVLGAVVDDAELGNRVEFGGVSHA